MAVVMHFHSQHEQCGTHQIQETWQSTEDDIIHLSVCLIFRYPADMLQIVLMRICRSMDVQTVCSGSHYDQDTALCKPGTSEKLLTQQSRLPVHVGSMLTGDPEQANGFVFDGVDEASMDTALDRALNYYRYHNIDVPLMDHSNHHDFAHHSCIKLIACS